MTKRGAARGQPSLRCCIFTDHRPHFIFIIRLRRHRSRDNSAQTTHSSKNSAVWVCPVHSPQTNGAILVFCKPPIRFICTFHTYQRFYITSVSDYMWVWAGCRVRRTYGGCGGWARDHCFTRCSHMCKPETTGPDLQTFSNCVVATEAGIFEEISEKLAAENQVLLGHFAWIIARETPPHQRPLSDGHLNVFWRDTAGTLDETDGQFPLPTFIPVIGLILSVSMSFSSVITNLLSDSTLCDECVYCPSAGAVWNQVWMKHVGTCRL